MLIGWLLIALAGLAIGATSIGGVLVVPALSLLMGMALPDAIAMSSQAFLWTGLWILIRLPRLGLDLLRQEWVLLTAALAGAVIGAWLSVDIPGNWLRAWIGALALLSGGYGIARATGHLQVAHARAWPGWGEQAVLGWLVGLGSALSGTGGPVMLLPLLMLSRRDFERSVQLALVLQVPIALSATATHALAGRLNLPWGLGIALVLVTMALLGRALARKISSALLQGATAWLLLGTGVWLMSI